MFEDYAILFEGAWCLYYLRYNPLLFIYVYQCYVIVMLVKQACFDQFLKLFIVQVEQLSHSRPNSDKNESSHFSQAVVLLDLKSVGMRNVGHAANVQNCKHDA